MRGTPTEGDDDSNATSSFFSPGIRAYLDLFSPNSESSFFQANNSSSDPAPVTTGSFVEERLFHWEAGSTMVNTDTTTNLLMDASFGSPTGKFYEAMICDTKLSDADREKYEGYLAHKWGIQATTLPSGHPYESAAPTI